MSELYSEMTKEELLEERKQLKKDMMHLRQEDLILI